MIEANTVNICLGHLPFPPEFNNFVDLMVAPKHIPEAQNLAIVMDDRLGPNGHTLSEYSQLLWIFENLDRLVPHACYVRIFHYRRFVARTRPVIGERSTNISWALTIRNSDIAAFAGDFDRYSTDELFNTPVQFDQGVIGQYCGAHILADFLAFTQFLIEEELLSPAEALRFVQMRRMIPSCNIGVFRKETYAWVFSILARAALFLNSRHFVLRSDYQRRSVGFLLERLHSYLILRRIEVGATTGIFGHNLVLTDGTVVSATS